MGGPLGARWQIAGDPLSAFPRRKHPRTNHQELRYALMRNERGRAECRSCMIPASGGGSQVRNGANFRDDPQPHGDLAVLVGGRLGKRPSAQRYDPFRGSICAGSGEIREPGQRTGNNGPAAGSVLWRSARCEGSPARRDNTQGKRTMLIRTRAQTAETIIHIEREVRSLRAAKRLLRSLQSAIPDNDLEMVVTPSWREKNGIEVGHRIGRTNMHLERH